MSEFQSLSVIREGSIAEVVMRGPGKGNAMGPEFWREMPMLFSELDRDVSIRAVIIRGQGEHFSYGLDLKAMAQELGPFMMGQNLAAERTRLLDLIRELQGAFTNVQRCRHPVIAAISGWCIGGALDLLTACDIRVCSKDARFSVREVKVAMVADLGTLQRLPRIIGQGATRELALTGKNIDAPRALQLGLVSEVFETPEQLLTSARALAQQIADNPPLVVQGVKKVLNYCADKSDADGLDYVALWNSAFLQSADLVEALTAFAERRPPKYQGK